MMASPDCLGSMCVRKSLIQLQSVVLEMLSALSVARVTTNCR